VANALANETSPYLLQHAGNPVDWMPWGDEAFARARRADKPLLISIGYSACHWCHVMEHESFEREDVAALMNERFVCVKVDREERPDVDAIYMEALQAMTGGGGWPLNAFVTPDGVPFWAGTYFPPEPRQGAPSWPQVLEGIAEAWRDRRAEIVEGAGRIVPRLRGAAHLVAGEEPLDPGLPAAAVAGLRKHYDAQHGGWGGAPKFPAASLLDFLLGQGEPEMALRTLRAMANGGIYDHIGGGFARYSVDERWEIPHFEKMLYDNALLARAYLHGWQVSGDPLLRRVCEETLDWMLLELRQEEGGFASALDADAEGVEGKFTVWTPDEMRAVLGDELGEIAIRHYGLDRPPNFPDPASGERRTGEDTAWNPVRATSDPPERGAIRAQLYEARALRVWPGLDDKRLTSWNALAISALAEAGAVLERADYLRAAVECAEFVERDLRERGSGQTPPRLLRTYNRGQAKIGGFLEDHAFLLEAYLTLYEATFDPRWFAAARELAATLIERFGDSEHGGFFSTAADGDGGSLVARRKDLEDAPIPSGASSATYGLLRLAALTGEHAWEEAGLGTIRLLHQLAPQHPSAFGHLLQAIAFHLAPPKEIAVVGDDAAALLRVVRAQYRPYSVLAGGHDGGEVPLLRDREPIDGRAAAYVCERFACQRPVTEPEDLNALL
jgi:uncharacterized protein